MVMSKDLSKRYFWFIAITSFLLAVCKGGQFYPVLGLLLILPVERFRSKNSKVVFMASILGISALTLILWMWLMKQYGYNNVPPWKVDPAGQIRWILANPFRYALILFHTIKIYGIEYYQMLIGNLGWLDTNLPNYVYLLYLVLFPLSLFLENEETIFTKIQRIVLVGLVTIESVGIFTMIYLGWTSVGGETILGVQGRYFLPILVVLLLAIYPGRGMIKNLKVQKTGAYFLTAGIGFALIVALLVVAGHNYLWQSLPVFNYLTGI